jgi:hypothetical protein
MLLISKSARVLANHNCSATSATVIAAIAHVRIVFCRMSTNTDQIGYRLENVPSGGEQFKAAENRSSHNRPRTRLRPGGRVVG